MQSSNNKFHPGKYLYLPNVKCFFDTTRIDWGGRCAAEGHNGKLLNLVLSLIVNLLLRRSIHPCAKSTR